MELNFDVSSYPTYLFLSDNCCVSQSRHTQTPNSQPSPGALVSPPVFHRAPFSGGSFPSQAPGRCLCSWSASRCYSSSCVSLADVFSLLCLLPAVPGREGHDFASSPICPVGISWGPLGAWFPSPGGCNLSFRTDRHEWPGDLPFAGGCPRKGPSFSCLGIGHFRELLGDGGSSQGPDGS